MRLVIDQPAGMIPLVEPSKLPVNNAIKAVNCRFDNGSLRPYAGLNSEVATLAVNTQTIFYYEDLHWFSWDAIIHIVESPINNDAFGRAYFTGDGTPKMTVNSVATGSGVMPVLSYRMGVRQPDVPLITSIDNNIQNEAGQGDDITTFYVITYVNAYGEEGMPSPLSTEVTKQTPEAVVNLSFSGVANNDQNIISRRLYRVADDAYRLVAVIPLATLTYADIKLDYELGIVLDTFSFSEPMQDLEGLTIMANGILAGFSGRTVSFSEAFLPHAWPIDYQQTTAEEVVAMKAIGNSLVVTTKGKPYLFTGVSPDAISAEKIEIAQACVSSRSMVDMGEYVMYASPDGLVAISASSATVVTEGLFNKRTWAQYQPETIHAEHYEGKYVAFYGGTAGFIFDPKTKNFIELDFYAQALYNDLLTDTLYLSVSGQLRSFDESLSSLTFEWAKSIRLDYRVSPSCAYVDLEDAATVSFKVEVDGQEIVNYASLDGVGINQLPGESPVFRLPAIRGKECVITVGGTGEVHRIAVGSNMKDVQHG
jgi:hypothetical protein